MHVINGHQFLAVPNNFCLALNVDWFNPYKQTPYSVGAIYLTVLNLPRAERFKPHNMMLVGLIPGPRERADLNPFLRPLVNHLKRLYEGLYVTYASKKVKIRAVLACITYDLPATRKVCGFSNFSTLKGCSKCLKTFFPTASFGSKPDYSGYDVESWPKRDSLMHIQKSVSAKNAKILAERSSIEHTYGCKYSVLCDLTAFDDALREL